MGWSHLLLNYEMNRMGREGKANLLISAFKFISSCILVGGTVHSSTVKNRPNSDNIGGQHQKQSRCIDSLYSVMAVQSYLAVSRP